MPCLAFFLSPGCGPVIIGTANMLIADVWLLNRVSGLDKALYGGEGGILCQGPRDPENRYKISVSRQPRRVVCTGSMYRSRRLGSSGFAFMVNAFHGQACDLAGAIAVSREGKRTTG